MSTSLHKRALIRCFPSVSLIFPPCSFVRFSTFSSSSSSFSPPSNPWYSFHRSHYQPLSLFQRVLLTSGASFLSLVNTHRGDLIAAIGELTANNKLKDIHKKLLQSEQGRLIIHEKPRMILNSLGELPLRSSSYLSSSALSSSSFGHFYLKFLSSHGYSPSERSPVRFISDPELAYVIQRYREIHDFLHVLTGLQVTIIGELAIKQFEFLQTGLPMTWLSQVAAVKLTEFERKILQQVYLPWAQQAAQQAELFLSVYWEDYWTMEIEQLRKKFNFIQAPIVEYPPGEKISR
jgi:ubiquinone biosynthesis protein COQ4